MLLQYYTIKEDSINETEIKKSRFICSLKRVTSEAEAKEFIQKIKKEHWKANHNCSAFVIGEKSEIQRSSDDGEPSGTAGTPMLEVLKKNELINVCAVVTRYFGGIKLGTGGLIRAYSGSVAETLKNTGIVEGRLQQAVSIGIAYPLLGKLQNYLELAAIPIKNTDFSDSVVVTCMIDQADVADFIAQITDLLSGNAEFQKGDVSYFETPKK